MVLHCPRIKFTFIKAQGLPESHLWLSLDLYLSTDTTLQLAYTHIPCVPSTLKYLLKVHTKPFLFSQSVVKSSLAYHITPRQEGWGSQDSSGTLFFSLVTLTILYYSAIVFCFWEVSAVRLWHCWEAKDVFFWLLCLQAEHSSQICLATCYQYVFSL